MNPVLNLTRHLFPILLLVLGAAPSLQAADAATELLFPDGAPGAKGTGPADKPEITVHLASPEKATGAAVIVCPGGGYGALMLSYEGHDIAQWLNDQGIAGIVLKYRVTPYQHPAPLLDATRAMRLIRSRAAILNIDPARIGIMGFSAGGHLAATLGTHFDAGDATAADPIERVSSRPDFLVLVYPVISMGPKGHGGSRTNLLGKNPSAETKDFLSNEKQVTGKTPPAFLVHSKLDKVVSIEHSAMFNDALKAHNVPSTFLELATGEHGLGCGKGPLWAEWQAKCAEWFKTMKIVSAR